MFKIICVTNRKLAHGDFLKQLNRIAEAKPDAIVLREKDLTEEEYSILAAKVMDICGASGIECILHGFVSAAEALGADSLHLPLPYLKELDRSETGRFGKMGTSCHSASDVMLAERLGASYATLGHIFETDCKKGLPPRGLSILREATKEAAIPVYAIGGINESNIVLTKEAGASGACIMSGFMTSDDPAALIGKLRSKVK